MRRSPRNLASLLLAVGMLLVLPGASPARTAAAGATAQVDAEGKVSARPDMAILVFEVLTEAPQAKAAAEENARRADTLLKALKPLLGPEEKLKSLFYRVFPVSTYNQKLRRSEITGYRAENLFQVELRDLARLGSVIDTGLKNGANDIRGPNFKHAKLEELKEQAYVAALERARRLADALAKSQNLKVSRLLEVSTSLGVMPAARPMEAMRKAKAAAPAPTTPIEVGEEEIRAHIWAVFELGS
jgi:uncharacterized protein YggE